MPATATLFSAPPRAVRQSLRVGFVMLDKFTLNAFSGFIDALRLAADKGGRSRQIRCGWEIMGGAVTASCGLKITPTAPLLPPASFDYVAVCGGNGYLETTQPDWLTAYLRQAAAEGVPLVGVCTGTFNIARAGLMTGYPACVHWNVLEAFSQQFPEIETRPDRIFLDAGRRITCAGSAGATDMALHLIDRHCGHEEALQAVRHMMLDTIRPSDAPQPHFYNSLGHLRDQAVRHAVALMEQSLNRPLSVQELAEAVGLSPRQFHRRFVEALGRTPAAFQLDLRLRYAAFLLRHTTQPITEIAYGAGFADGAHLSKSFKERLGVPPRVYRRAPPTDAEPPASAA